MTLAGWVNPGLDPGATQQLSTHRDALGRAKGLTQPTVRREVALLADTFNTYFEPGNLNAAYEVLQGLGYDVTLPAPITGTRRAAKSGMSS